MSTPSRSEIEGVDLSHAEVAYAHAHGLDVETMRKVKRRMTLSRKYDESVVVMALAAHAENPATVDHDGLTSGELFLAASMGSNPAVMLRAKQRIRAREADVRAQVLALQAQR